MFKTLWDKGLIYESYRSMHICPRCETTLSQQEVSDNYIEVKDLSVTAKFELVDEPGTFVLAWTTTPWTLPGNVALAVGRDIEYTKIKLDDGVYVIAQDRVSATLKKHSGEKVFDAVEIGTIKGADLLGKAYKPLFDTYANDTTLENHANGWKIYAADFVTTEEGTGVVYIAPAFWRR